VVCAWAKPSASGSKTFWGVSSRPACVSHGKGAKQRYVPITPAMVQELRAWWRTHQNPTLLFPTPGRGWADRTFTLSQSCTSTPAHERELCPKRLPPGPRRLGPGFGADVQPVGPVNRP